MALKSCNRVYYVSTTSSEDMNSWIKSVTSCINGVALTAAPAEKARVLNGHTFDNGSMASNPASGLKRFMYQPKSISFDSGSVSNEFYIPPTFVSTRSFSRLVIFHTHLPSISHLQSFLLIKRGQKTKTNCLPSRKLH